MGKDILHKLGIHLTASKPTGKTIGLISDTTIEQNKKHTQMDIQKISTLMR